jgi:hypothetical protein
LRKCEFIRNFVGTFLESFSEKLTLLEEEKKLDNQISPIKISGGAKNHVLQLTEPIIKLRNPKNKKLNGGTFAVED